MARSIATIRSWVVEVVGDHLARLAAQRDAARLRAAAVDRGVRRVADVPVAGPGAVDRDLVLEPGLGDEPPQHGLSRGRAADVAEADEEDAPACFRALDVDRLRSLGPVLGFVVHARAVGERAEAGAVDRRVVDEQVLAALVRGDEAEALVIVEPLDGSRRHRSCVFLSVETRTPRPGGATYTRDSRRTGEECVTWPSSTCSAARDGSLYCGWTVDLDRRLAAHAAGTGARYTRGRLPVAIAAAWEAPDRSAAQRLEDRVKTLTRPAKERLVAGAALEGAIRRA